MSIPAERVRFMTNWFRDLQFYLDEEVPLRIHSRDTADDGAPQWHSDFAVWLTRTDLNDRNWRENPEPRVRTTRAMRKLRQKHPREYEIMYRTIILGIPIAETIGWLNDRAIARDKPERYDREAVYLYLLNAAERTHAWW